MRDDALAIAAELRDALAAQAERARREREALRALDSESLQAYAAARSIFNATAARLERELARALGAPGAKGATRAAPLSRELADLRALAAALAEFDRLNMRLAQRALACVGGYLGALFPAPSAYNRRGLRAPQGPALGYSSKA